MPSLVFEIGYTLIFCILLLWIIGKHSYFKQFPFTIQSMQLAFIAKLIFGFTLTAIYTFYYTERNTADIYKYFDDSYYMYHALENNPIDYFKMLFGIGNDTSHFAMYYSNMAHWSREYDSNMFSDSHLIIRFNAFLRIFSFGCIHIHTVVACFLSFIGLLQLCKLFYTHFRFNPLVLLLAVFAVPSTLFWGSGVLKEAIILFAIGTLLACFDQAIKQKKIKPIPLFLMLFSVGLLLYSKIYILIGLLPGIIAWWYNSYTQSKRKILSHFIVYTSILLFGVFTTNGLDLISKKRHDFIEHAKGGTIVTRNTSDGNLDTLFIEAKYHHFIQKGIGYIHLAKPCKAYRIQNGNRTNKHLFISENTSIRYRILLDYGVVGSSIKSTELEPTLGAYLRELPYSLFQVLFRPFPNEIDSIFKLLAFMENLFFGFCLYRIWIHRKLLAQSDLAITAFFFSFILFALIGFTTPIFGAILRYKCLAYPLIVPLALINSDSNKV